MVRPLAVLIEHRDQALASVLNSTAALDFPELVPFIEQHLDTAARQAAAVDKRRRDYSATVSAGIRQAACHMTTMPLGVIETARRVQMRIARQKPETFGLRRVPGIETIRDELKSMRLVKLEPAPESLNRA